MNGNDRRYDRIQNIFGCGSHDLRNRFGFLLRAVALNEVLLAHNRFAGDGLNDQFAIDSHCENPISHRLDGGTGTVFTDRCGKNHAVSEHDCKYDEDAKERPRKINDSI